MPARHLPVVHHPAYTADLGGPHRFPMDKFARVAAAVEAAGLVPNGFYQPLPARRSELQMAHSTDYVDAVLARTLDRARVRRIGFELTPAVVLRARLATAGTLLAARLAMAHGIACNTAGGSHHAAAGGGAGFCVFNDVAVAARVLQAEGAVRTVLVVDLDVHHGDGTAAIFAGDPSVTTLSVHCRANWPVDPPESDIDVALEPGCTGPDYLAAAAAALDTGLALGPYDLAVVLAGVDVAAGDRLGRLALQAGDIAARERLVLERLAGAGIATVTVLAGGYHPDPDVLASLHLQVILAASEISLPY